MPDRSGARLAAEALVARLAAWRVPRVFGQPGEAVAPLVEALAAAGGEPEFVPTRHGESAAFMAIGHARLTGGLGVCLASPGPGAYGLLSGLEAAWRPGLPVLAMVGANDPPGDTDPSGDTDPLGDTDLPGETDPDRFAGPGIEGLFAGLCRHVRYAADPGRVAHLVDEAVRYAVTGAGPACLVLPRLAVPDRPSATSGPTGSVPVASVPVGSGLTDSGLFGSALTESGLLDPGLVLDELCARLPARGTVVVDGDPILTGYARHLRPRSGLTVGDTPGGGALPYAVAAKLAGPDRPVLALTGDAGMHPHGLTELVTVARRWPTWPDPRLVVVVLNTRTEAGHRPGTDDVPYAGWARLLGLDGVRVDRSRLVGAAWDAALAADRPCLLEMVLDRTHRPALADLALLVAAKPDERRGTATESARSAW